jgi:hypothetical protein
MARTRLTFIITWGLLWLSSQIPLILIFSAVNYNNMAVTVGEVGSAIFTAAITAMMLVKEDI